MNVPKLQRSPDIVGLEALATAWADTPEIFDGGLCQRRFHLRG